MAEVVEFFGWREYSEGTHRSRPFSWEGNAIVCWLYTGAGDSPVAITFSLEDSPDGEIWKAFTTPWSSVSMVTYGVARTAITPDTPAGPVVRFVLTVEAGKSMEMNWKAYFKNHG